MPNKKSTTKTAMPEKTTMIKIAEKVGEIAGRIVNEKDHLMSMAGGAIDSVKTSVQNMTSGNNSEVKKTAGKLAKKVAKKIIRPAVKKSAGLKKAVKKAASSVKKGSAKKAVKKAIKKAVKKVAKKSPGKKR